MRKVVFTILLSSWTISSATCADLVLNQECTTPGGHHGRCVPVRYCKFVASVLRKHPFTEDDQRYLDQFRCGELPDSGKVLTCCPELRSAENCGRLTLHDYILGGEETDPDEYPWMALLRYMDRKNRTSYNCGGALINERYVVTAAHCIANLRYRQLFEVRLGEWDLNTTMDCSASRCFVGYQDDYAVKKVTVHELYDANNLNKVHDIALIQLSKPVERTEMVAPICIPTREMDRSLKMDEIFYDVTGWGRTETDSSSSRKMKVTLPGQTIETCNKAFAAAKVTFTKDQICAGGVDGKDSCKGDSGGPLMTIQNNRWHLMGIVSLGAKDCGKQGLPAVNTRLGSYLQWIAEAMELLSREN